MFINLKTNELVGDVRSLFPGSSLPEVLTDENLYEHGFALVTDEQPAFDAATSTLAMGSVVQKDGKWVRQWSVVPLPDDVLKNIAVSKVVDLEHTSIRAIREALLTGDKTRLLANEKAIANLMGRAPVAS